MHYIGKARQRATFGIWGAWPPCPLNPPMFIDDDDDDERLLCRGGAWLRVS